MVISQVEKSKRELYQLLVFLQQKSDSAVLAQDPVTANFVKKQAIKVKSIMDLLEGVARDESSVQRAERNFQESLRRRKES